jgi:hypothetical protein
MAKQRVGSIRWVRETSSDNAANTDAFIQQAIIQALARVNRANLGFAIFNEDEERQTTVVFEKFTSPPSEEMKRLMEFEFGPVEDPPAVTA